MSEPVQEASVTCPWCWQLTTLVVDLSGGDQRCVEDCSVCCNPMDVTIATDGESVLHLEAQRQE